MDRTVKASEAKADEIRRFLVQHTNNDPGPKATLAMLKAKLAEVHDKPEFVLCEPEPHDVAKPAPAGFDITSAADPIVTLILIEQEGPGGKRDLQVSVNGRLMLLPRGRPIDVPYRYFEALKNAVQTLYDPDPEDKHNLVSREVPSYPFSVVRAPSADEVAAWHARHGAHSIAEAERKAKAA